MIFKRRKDDRRLFKYLLPYGYMRRHLARVYGFEVKNGEFVASSMAKTNAHGFTWMDLLPLGVVEQPASQRPAASASARVLHFFTRFMRGFSIHEARQKPPLHHRNSRCECARRR